MANVKISDLTDAGTITGAELIEIVQAAASRKVTAANLIYNDSVTNAKLANMATATIKGRTTAGTGDPEDLTPAQARTVIATLEALTGSRTYFVRTDGSDSNTGLSNTAGGAFLTIQKAIDTVAGLLIGPHGVTINVADGTYTGAISVNGPWLGTGTVTLTGNTTTPANCILSRTGGTCLSLTNGGRLQFGGFEFRTTTSGNAVSITNFAFGTVSGAIRFGAIATNGVAFNVASGGSLSVSANMAITAALHVLFQVSDFGSVVMNGSMTHTFTGTWAWGFAAVLCTRIASVVGAPTLNIAGATITGTRYQVDNNSLISTFGSGASYYPGSSVGGTAATGGLYV